MRPDVVRKPDPDWSQRHGPFELTKGALNHIFFKVSTHHLSGGVVRIMIEERVPEESVIEVPFFLLQKRLALRHFRFRIVQAISLPDKNSRDVT